MLNSDPELFEPRILTCTCATQSLPLRFASGTIVTGCVREVQVSTGSVQVSRTLRARILPFGHPTFVTLSGEERLANRGLVSTTKCHKVARRKTEGFKPLCTFVTLSGEE